MADWLNNDRELLARTLMAEAGNQGVGGMLAAGSVIMNRAKQGGYGDGVRGVILKPGQFSPLNSLTGYAGGEQGQDMAAIRPTSEAYSVADALLSGDYTDPTGGATHFYNPDISSPSWGGGEGWTRIGAHVFGKADAGRSGGMAPQQRPTGPTMSSMGSAQMAQQSAPQDPRQPFYKNPDFWDRAALAFGGLSMHPNQALMQMSADRLQQSQEMRKTTQQRNRTAEWLRSQGRKDLADAVLSGTLDGQSAAALAYQKRGQVLTAAQANEMFPGADLPAGGLYNLSANGNLTKVGGSPQAVIQMPADEKAWEKGMGEYGVKTYERIQDEAQAADAMLTSTAQLEALMADPNFRSGALTQPVMAGKRIIEALGGDPANVSSMEAFKSVTGRLILDSMGGSLGAGFSEGDRQFVESMQPSLDTSMAGNQLIIGMQRAIANRRLQIAEFADRYVAENGMIDAKFNSALREWAKQNPLFKAADPGAYLGGQ